MRRTKYFRRFRMEFDLTRRIPEPTLPDGYRWSSWNQALLESHAEVKSASFRGEVDTQLFRSLSNIEGCRRLMREITLHNHFIPESTWLIRYQPDFDMPAKNCGTIQGLKRSRVMGAVQNVGIVPEHRGLGLGRALVLKALQGFRRVRMARVCLDVTAKNTNAVELYRSIGFRLLRTSYKEVRTAQEAALV